ncbi:phage tail protein [Xenorhabdus cabanillasii]|uniref:Phage tail fibre protein N-terminal domain-containing protein n=1 Tax=Xenorhabdus cabanillasii JM26 TaxID=1427517 RepID=W1J8V3_9GAMM|nr:phage tail protein [Xenorhabdus cabanillasii]PHM76280.1 tail fiber protein [Xenorhabdus cabanillasii JM26]CDL87197.1 hypothetical protein XCR1_850006 [Xenorhabdus cabanillasii JM26]
MSSVITLDFEKWKAQQVAAGNAVVLDEFVFANVPDLDPSQDISRSEQLPAAQYIVHRQAVNKTGLASENAVAYSVTLGTEVGNFDFNWIGLLNKASGVIGMITHAPAQKKIKTANGLQGNVLTRSFLLEFDGAAKETAITTTAETWQIDFTARLSGMDEMQRLINTDSYGEAAFFDEGFAVIRNGDQYTVKKGLAYVGGLRGVLEHDQTLNTMRNTRVYADFSYQGNLVSQWETAVKITVANDLKNYVDAAGYLHYVFAISRVDGDGNVIDLRPKDTLSDRDIANLQKELGQVKQDYATKTALSNGLNEKQPKGDYATNSALNAVNNNVNNRLEKAQNGADIPNKAAFVSNVGAYPKTGGKILGEVMCQRLTLEADIPYLAGFDTHGERQFFCGRAGDGPLYFKNDTTEATLKITDEFHFNRVVSVPSMTVKAEIPYIAGFDPNGKRQFFCGRAFDGPLYFKNDATEATLKITDVFYFNNQVIPANYANFDQRYQIRGEIRLFPFRQAELPTGWYHCNGERHLTTSAIGRALAQLSGSYKSDFKITVSGSYINLPNFYLDGRGLFMRPSTAPGQVVPDTFRAHSHPDSVSSIEGGRVNYAESTAVAWFSSSTKHYSGYSRRESEVGGAETAPIHIGMTPAVFLGV